MHCSAVSPGDCDACDVEAVLLLVAVADAAFDGLANDADDKLVATDFSVNNGKLISEISYCESFENYVLQAVDFELTQQRWETLRRRLCHYLQANKQNSETMKSILKR